jgi:toxin FitB
MSYLIDTCCISELIKKEPDVNVVSWFSSVEEAHLFLSVITFGELRKGIDKLPESKRKRELSNWINDDLTDRFKNRIIDISIAVSNEWGSMLAQAELSGKPIPAIDAMIASTALVHNLVVVTRNTRDFETAGVELMNPWIPYKLGGQSLGSGL